MSSINFEFQRSIPFTEFVDNGSWLQKRDPGAYLLGFILFFTGVLITQSWTVIGAGLILCLVGIWLSKIRISLYLKGLLKALPFILIIAVINLFINPAKDFSEVIFQFWIIKSYNIRMPPNPYYWFRDLSSFCWQSALRLPISRFPALYMDWRTFYYRSPG